MPRLRIVITTTAVLGLLVVPAQVWAGDAANSSAKPIHVGDIKSESTFCSDARFASVDAAFVTFRDPLIYTPGRQRVADYHRVNNGQFNPLERLAALRSLFFAEPGEPLGRHPKHLAAQPAWPEN